LPEESGPMSIQKQKPKKVVVDTSWSVDWKGHERYWIGVV
jgi:hypothetical protein